jgi:hypothetical protein
MNIPGFTAELSAYKTRNYYTTSLTFSDAAAGVNPAQNSILSGATVTGFRGHCRVVIGCDPWIDPYGHPHCRWVVKDIVCDPYP